MTDKKYRVRFHGTTEMVVKMANEFDRVLKWYYNVYGGRLVEAYKGDENEQVMTFEYFAHWDKSWLHWPGFEEIRKAANRRLNNRGFGIKWSEEAGDGGAWFEYLD